MEVWLVSWLWFGFQHRGRHRRVRQEDRSWGRVLIFIKEQIR